MSNKNTTSLEKVLNYSIYYEDSFGFSHYENGLMIDYVDFMRKIKDVKSDSSYTFYKATGSYKGIMLSFCENVESLQKGRREIGEREK